MQSLTAMGQNVTLFAHPEGELLRRAQACGVAVVPLPCRGRRLLLRRCSKVVAAAGVNLLHVHDSRSSSLGAYLGRRLKVPVVLSRRIASPVRRNLLSRLKYSRRNFRAVIAISNTVKEVFTATTGFTEDEVFVVPSGVDIGELDSVERDSEFRRSFKRQYIVGGLGKLSPKKNWQFLIRVAAQMVHSDLDIQWLIAGDGSEREALEMLAHELGVDDRICFLGFREDALRILKNLDLLFFPSIMEGASVTVRECMVLGTPVVAVDAAGTMESLAGYGCGIADGDIDAAAEAVTTVLTNSALRDEYITGARRYAVEHYTYDRTAAGTLAVYRKILAGNDE
jgi:glycosyltransferase involved in cell wall biosynthesis